MRVKIKLLKEGAKLPSYQSEFASAADLYAAVDTPLTIPAGDRARVPTGIAIECERVDIAAVICARSGLAAKHGITLANGIGVVDPDYRGEIMVALMNVSDTDYQVQPGERIAQLMLVPVLRGEFEISESLNDTERGAGGFGSTGKA